MIKKQIRLDKFLQLGLDLSRKEAQHWLKKKTVLLNGEVIKEGKRLINPRHDVITLAGERLTIPLTFRYFMLNKPSGFVSSHVDEGHPSLFRLLKEPKPRLLKIAGRLDADTTGLTLLTDDGAWLHKVTHPNQALPKRYMVKLREPLTKKMTETLTRGVTLKEDDKPTLPARLTLLDDFHCYLTIKEGRYHQVKRMLAAVGNQVLALNREQIGSLSLGCLKEGEYRLLSEQEVEDIFLNVGIEERRKCKK